MQHGISFIPYIIMITKDLKIMIIGVDELDNLPSKLYRYKLLVVEIIATPTIYLNSKNVNA